MARWTLDAHPPVLVLSELGLVPSERETRQADAWRWVWSTGGYGGVGVGVQVPSARKRGPAVRRHIRPRTVRTSHFPRVNPRRRGYLPTSFATRAHPAAPYGKDWRDPTASDLLMAPCRVPNTCWSTSKFRGAAGSLPRSARAVPPSGHGTPRASAPNHHSPPSAPVPPANGHAAPVSPGRSRQSVPAVRHGRDGGGGSNRGQVPFGCLPRPLHSPFIMRPPCRVGIRICAPRISRNSSLAGLAAQSGLGSRSVVGSDIAIDLEDGGILDGTYRSLAELPPGLVLCGVGRGKYTVRYNSLAPFHLDMRWYAEMTSGPRTRPENSRHASPEAGAIGQPRSIRPCVSRAARRAPARQQGQPRHNHHRVSCKHGVQGSDPRPPISPASTPPGPLLPLGHAGMEGQSLSVSVPVPTRPPLILLDCGDPPEELGYSRTRPLTKQRWASLGKASRQLAPIPEAIDPGAQRRRKLVRPARWGGLILTETRPGCWR